MFIYNHLIIYMYHFKCEKNFAFIRNRLKVDRMLLLTQTRVLLAWHNEQARRPIIVESHETAA